MMSETVAPSVIVVQDATRVTITLGEGLDVADVPELLAAARAASHSGREVLVECSGPSFLSSAVVQVIAALQRACRERGLRFVVEGVQESAAAYLHLAGLGSIIRL